MTLSWETILREIDRYFAVWDLQLGCKWTFVKLVKEEVDRYQPTSILPSPIAGALAGKAASTRGERLPGDNFDLYGNALAGVVMGQALVAAGELVGTIIEGLEKQGKLRSRPFLSSPGAHKEFENFLKGQTSSFTEWEIFSDVSRALSFVFDGRLMREAADSLVRSEKLLKLIDMELIETARCTGSSHPFTLAVRQARKEGVDPWKDNEANLSESAAIALLSRATQTTGWKPKNAVPTDFSTFFDAHPTYDGFGLIVLWKAKRLETALHEVLRGILHESWSCEVEPASPDPVSRESHWDFMTETESFTERGARSPGAGHPGVDPLGDIVYDLEQKRRSYTNELPPRFSTMAKTVPELPDFDLDKAFRHSTVPEARAVMEHFGWGGGLSVFRKRFEKEKTDREKRVKDSAPEAVGKLSDYDKIMGEEPILKYYGGMEGVSQAFWNEKDLLPLFQSLRSVDMKEWWTRALEMKRGEGMEQAIIR
jgi:hypothetical protein